jgi:hypothetical protein
MTADRIDVLNMRRRIPRNIEGHMQHGELVRLIAQDHEKVPHKERRPK